MPLSSLRLWVVGLAYTAGLARELVGFLVPSKHALSPIQLRKSIVGHTKKEVARLLGPPPAAGIADNPPAPPTYWMANTWYYPFDPRRHTAMAVQFNANRVVEVEFIGG